VREFQPLIVAKFEKLFAWPPSASDSSVSLRASREDIIQETLFSPRSFLFPCIALASLHVAEHLAITMRRLVSVGLSDPALFQYLKRFKQRHPAIGSRIGIVIHALDLQGGQSAPQCLVSRLVCRGNRSGNAFDVASHPRHLQQQLLQCQLFALLYALTEAEHCREWKSKGHDGRLTLNFQKLFDSLI
jgi:hypothetical protein